MYSNVLRRRGGVMPNIFPRARLVSFFLNIFSVPNQKNSFTNHWRQTSSSINKLYCVHVKKTVRGLKSHTFHVAILYSTNVALYSEYCCTGLTLANSLGQTHRPASCSTCAMCNNLFRTLKIIVFEPSLLLLVQLVICYLIFRNLKIYFPFYGNFFRNLFKRLLNN